MIELVLENIDLIIVSFAPTIDYEYFAQYFRVIILINFYHLNSYVHT